MRRPSSWQLRPGDTIRRKNLHDMYGGIRQGGISPSRVSPNIFIFSDRRAGDQYGYFDHWVGEEFHYAGHGQRGDQEMTRGNLAILRHEKEGRALRVFGGVRGEVRYIGEFKLADDQLTFSRLLKYGGEPDESSCSDCCRLLNRLSFVR